MLNTSEKERKQERLVKNEQGVGRKNEKTSRGRNHNNCFFNDHFKTSRLSRVLGLLLCSWNALKVFFSFKRD